MIAGYQLDGSLTSIVIVLALCALFSLLVPVGDDEDEGE